MTFVCERCGWCCKNLSINISYSDIMRWLREQRWDILRQVNFVRFKKEEGFYFGKTVGEKRVDCSFLVFENGGFACLIYDTRPKACIDYPMSQPNSKCPANPKFDKQTTDIIKSHQYQDYKKIFLHKKEIFLILAIVYEFKKELDSSEVDFEKGKFLIPQQMHSRVVSDSDSKLKEEGIELLERVIEWQY